jgi:hypothetical protein
MNRRLLALAVPALLLAGCSSDPGALVPGPSPSPSPFGLAEGEGWVVHGQNDYVDGSSTVCSYEDLLTNPDIDPEFFGLYLEQGPGLPDDWMPGDVYQVSADGILLNFATGEYEASRFDGDDSTGIGSLWDSSGTFTFDRDAQGVITGGHGTGKTQIIHESGDVERPSDTMTFTVTVAPQPPWCTITGDE